MTERRRRRRGSKSYEVGYGKPPVNERFGQETRTGRVNTKGQPKKKKAPPSLNDALDEKVAVSEGGRRKTYTRRQIIYKQVARRASEGDLRAANMVLEYDARRKEEGEDADPFGIDPKLMEGMLKKHDEATAERARRTRRRKRDEGDDDD